MKNILYLLIITLLFVNNVFAQKQKSTTQFWVSSGVGQSVSETFTKKSGLVGGTGFSCNFKQQLVSLQINHFWETNMEKEMQGDFTEWKIQYGWINRKKKNQIYTIGGVGYSECNHFREVFSSEGMSIQKDVTTKTAFGGVAEMGFNYVLHKNIGIGIASFANFNKNALSVGYRINILLGLFNND